MAAPEPSRPSVLIAEDYDLIGIMLDEELREAGFEVAGPFASCAAALAWLKSETPDAAILDIQLSDGRCVEVALTLKERRVPFLVLTGEPPHAPHEEAFSDAPRLEKPMSQQELLEVLRGLLRPELDRRSAS
jgi:DNA-binding response OmpR family regulator